MSEKNLVINGLEIRYSGIFNFDEFYGFLNHVLEERGYHKHEKRFEETVKPTGKDLFIELRPVKTKTSYFSFMLKIRIEIKNIKEVTVTVSDQPASFQEGDIFILFDAFATTDYDQRWGMNPVPYFIKGFIHKYIYHFKLEEGFMGEVAGDCKYVHQQVKAHLNLYRYKTK